MIITLEIFEMVKVAIYARVSTSERKKRRKRDGAEDPAQNPETQLRACRIEAEKRGWVVHDEYIDRTSGLNPHKPEQKRALMDGARNRFSYLIVFKIDRLTREGIKATLDTLEKFEGYGVKVISVTEPYLSSDAPMAELVRAVLAWAAQFESERISERTKAGMERARAEGAQIGRPRATPEGSRTTRWRDRQRAQAEG